MGNAITISGNIFVVLRGKIRVTTRVLALRHLPCRENVHEISGNDSANNPGKDSGKNAATIRIAIRTHELAKLPALRKMLNRNALPGTII